MDLSLANKAAYIGARQAVIAAPVATGITDLNYNATLLGQPCFDSTGTATGNCPTVNTTCTPNGSSGGNCTGGETFDNAAFTTIFNPMNRLFAGLQRQN